MTEVAPGPPNPDRRDGRRAAAGRVAFRTLRIKTADFEPVPILDRPMIAETGMSDSARACGLTDAAGPPGRGPADRRACPPAAPAAAKPRTDNSGRFAPVAPPRVNASELQKIVTLRICALGDERWSGRKLIDALELQGLAYGRYQVFHRNHVDGRTMFCVASLSRTGSFRSGADVRTGISRHYGLCRSARTSGAATDVRIVDRDCAAIGGEPDGHGARQSGRSAVAAARRRIARRSGALSGHAAVSARSR